MDYEYLFRKIADRRGAHLVRVDSVAFNQSRAFGTLDNTALLPAAANTFYFIRGLGFSTLTAQATAPINLQFTAYAGGVSVVFSDMAVNTSKVFSIDIEMDSLLYRVNGNTAGEVAIFGTVFKIKYA